MARLVQRWPDEARPHYIELFSLSERLRAHLKVAQELARTKRLISYQKQLVEPDGILRNIYPLLKRMQREVAAIRAVYLAGDRAIRRGGRPPKWYSITVRIDALTRQISQTMSLVELDLLSSLDVAVIKKTTGALLSAQEIRNLQLSLPLDRAEIGLDEYGLEVINDLFP